MAIITNTHRTALSVRDVTLQPNAPTPVHNWAEISKNAVVAAWVAAGILQVDDAAAGDQGSQYVQPDKAELHAKLDALQVQYDKRSGVAKLQALLEAAEAQREADAAAAAQHALALERAAAGFTPEAWNALTGDERDAEIEKAVEAIKADAARVELQG